MSFFSLLSNFNINSISFVIYYLLHYIPYFAIIVYDVFFFSYYIVVIVLRSIDWADIGRSTRGIWSPSVFAEKPNRAIAYCTAFLAVAVCGLWNMCCGLRVWWLETAQSTLRWRRECGAFSWRESVSILAVVMRRSIEFWKFVSVQGYWSMHAIHNIRTSVGNRKKNLLVITHATLKQNLANAKWN